MAGLDGVDDRAGRQEQQRLEEGVRHQVEHAGHVAAQAHGGNHEAQLRDGGIGQHLLDIELRHRHRGGKQRRGRADDGDRLLRDRRQGEERAGAGDHVNAGRDHRGGMDQGRDRRGAGHGIRQPDVQRNLRRLAGRAQQQQQGDGGHHLRAGLQRHAAILGTLVEDQRVAQVPEDQEHGQQHGPVAHAVDDEGFAAGAGIGGAAGALLKPEADQQVRAQAHAFPADEHHQVAVAGHQDQHGGQEQVEVDEEAREAGRIAVEDHVLVHVADGVNVDERAHAGDHQHHRHRQRIDLERPRHPQVADDQPVEQVDGLGLVAVGGQAHPLEHGDDESQRRGAGGDQANPFFAQEMAPGQVDEQTQHRENDDQRDEAEIRHA